MTREIDRRGFVQRGLSLGAGAAVLGALPRDAVASIAGAGVAHSGVARGSSGGGTTPMVMTSHSNETGHNAMVEAWDILSSGGKAIDAVERGANIIEVEPVDTSVGYGGLPNEEGVVQLDSSVMDGATYNAGSVAGIEGIKNPASVARLVMERTDHIMLAAQYAQRFAVDFGFKVEDLMTEKSRKIWLKWREERSDRDDWGPPDHLKKPAGAAAGGGRASADALEAEAEWWAELLDLPGRDGPDREYVLADALLHRYGTTNVLAVDADGNVAGITTTSGLAFKIPGRIGDSPIIGAGLYVDNDVGAAGVTGRGEDVIKSCASYFIVGQMGAGRTPQEACEDAAAMIKHKYRNVNPDYVPGEKFVAINKAGDWGAAQMPFRNSRPRLTLANASGIEVMEGVSISN